MDNDLIKKMDNQIQNFKKFRDYIDLLDKEIAKQGFLLLDENSYKRNIKEFAVKKSEFVTLFADKVNLTEWFSQTTTQNKNYLYDLITSNNLEITKKDLDILSQKERTILYTHNISTPSYELNPSYTKEKASIISSCVKELYTVDGEKHLKTQKQADTIIKNSLKDYSTQQKTCHILYEKFGDNYDDVLSDFRISIKNKEVEQAGKSFIITTKSLEKPQKLKISVDEFDQISQITTVPPSIQAINDKFRKTSNNQQSMKIN